MQDEIHFTILGEPKAQKRHRTYTRGKGGKPLRFARQVDGSAEDKATFIAQARQHAPETPWDGPLKVMLQFSLSRPKGHYGTGRNAGKLKDSAPSHPITKPDLDNLVKLILDACNGIFWRDDAQIVTLFVFKGYAEYTPKTDVEIARIRAQEGGLLMD